MNDKVYVYALLGGSAQSGSFTAVEIDGKPEPVLGVWHNAVGLAVSRAPAHSFAGLSREAALNWLAIHQQVMGVLHQEFPLVPVKMGTVVDSIPDVRQILSENEHEFTQLLDSITGKVELDLVVSWREPEKVFTAIGEEQEIKSYKEALLAQDKLDQRELIGIGQMVKASLQRKKEAIREKVLAEFSTLADNYCLNEITGEETALNLALLVNSEREYEIEEKLDLLDQFYGGKMDFQAVWPLPPKSFATIEIKKITGEQLINAREVLQLPAQANLSEITTAKRALLHQHHPDKNTGAEGGRVLEIMVAYQLIEEYLRKLCLPSLPENLTDTYIVRVISVERGGGR